MGKPLPRLFWLPRQKRFDSTRVCCFVPLSFTISPCSAQDDRLNRVRWSKVVTIIKCTSVCCPKARLTVAFSCERRGTACGGWVGCKKAYRYASVCALFCTVRRNKSLSLRRGGRRCLQSKLGTKLHADGEVYVFVWIAYGSSFFNRNDLGPPRTSVPTGLI